jgi:predicted ArsR family transcriptional regulator
VKPENLETQIEAISLLAEPVRRSLYLFAASRPEGVGRDEAASAVGISRALAAFHLDKLTEAQLLVATYRRRGGRSGPGAGRPSKIYHRSSRQLMLSVPQRNYELAAHLFARALAAGAAEGSSGHLSAASFELGTKLGADARNQARGRPGRAQLLKAVQELLDRQGFECFRDEMGAIRVRNCPFSSLVDESESLTCGMTLSLVQGMVAGLEIQDSEVEPDRLPDTCCVVIRA